MYYSVGARGDVKMPGSEVHDPVARNDSDCLSSELIGPSSLN